MLYTLEEILFPLPIVPHTHHPRTTPDELYSKYRKNRQVNIEKKS